jgi:ribonucleoside-triphosphate reductase
MTPSNKLLSDLVTFRTYSKYLPQFERREIFEETINRTMAMHLERFPKLSKEIVKAFSMVHQLKIMPSMRTLQFSGLPIQKNNARGYNCSFTHITTARKFAEVLFLLLSGCGVGYSVQKHHVYQLATVKPPAEEGIFFVQDSIIGWAQALHALMDAYLNASVRPLFNFSNIRAKGSLLYTTGAKAPGPEPLKYMLGEVEKRLKAAIGRKLRPIEVHDIVCIISDCVLAGGIRRSSLIALFDRDDTEMLMAKTGNWYEKHPYRARANNSALLPRGLVTKEEFLHLFNIVQESGSGEPGFYWTNDLEMGANPCVEIGMRKDQFCNLTTINQTGIQSKKDYLSRIHSAALIGTLQAAYTDFPYLSEGWKQTTEAEALLGVSFTGIADMGNLVTEEWLEEGARLVLDINELTAKRIGINIAARTTCLKPEGSSSCTLGSSSGMRSRDGKYYLRRVQINNDDALTYYLKQVIPELIEDAYGVPNTSVITIPQESPEGAITRDMETAQMLFERTIKYNKHWVAPGHRSGNNKHNVSCTIDVKPDEWNKLAQSMWREREHYAGISLFPWDGGTYKQAPFEVCSKETYEQYSKLVKTIDLMQVKEVTNNTNLIESVACGGPNGSCEIKSI